MYLQIIKFLVIYRSPTEITIRNEFSIVYELHKFSLTPESLVSWSPTEITIFSVQNELITITIILIKIQVCCHFNPFFGIFHDVTSNRVTETTLTINIIRWFLN